MAVVRAGKFMMRLITFAVVTGDEQQFLGKSLDWE
jgi:hypothetical protein